MVEVLRVLGLADVRHARNARLMVSVFNMILLVVEVIAMGSVKGTYWREYQIEVRMLI